MSLKKIHSIFIQKSRLARKEISWLINEMFSSLLARKEISWLINEMFSSLLMLSLVGD